MFTKKLLITFFILLIFPVIIQLSFAQESKQEPSPPELPEPKPEPEPINLPKPEPIPDPFPGETDMEKIDRLSKENKKLKEENSKLTKQISELKNQNKKLQEMINGLNNSIEKLREITMEQIRVILDLVNKTKEIIIEKSFSSLIQI